MTKKDYIIDEYNRAKVRYEALKAMLKAEGIESGNQAQEQTQEQTKPVQQETQTQEQPKPTSTEPEIVYSGKSEIVLAVGESVKFSIYVNNVRSSRDYSVETAGDPTFYSCDEVGIPTNYGYQLDFALKGKIAGKGSIKVYLNKNRSECVNIVVIIRQ